MRVRHPAIEACPQCARGRAKDEEDLQRTLQLAAIAAGSEIASRQRVQRGKESRRTRYVLAKFLRKCNELIRNEPDFWFNQMGGLTGTAADLEMGEFSVLEYVDELIAEAKEKIP